MALNKSNQSTGFFPEVQSKSQLDISAGGAPAAITDALNAQRGNRKRDISQPGVSGLTSASGMIGSVNNKRTRFKLDQGSGPSFSRYDLGGTGANKSILDSFRASEAVRRPRSDNLPFQQSERSYNAQHPVVRFVKPLESKTSDPVGKFEIAIMFKDHSATSNDSIDLTAYYGKVSPEQEMAYRLRIQSNALTIVNIATWNYCQTLLQYAKFNGSLQDKEDYLKYEPMDLWKQWSVEGVVSYEEGADGSETFRTSGFNNDGNHTGRTGDGSKIVTIISKGAVDTFNIFGPSLTESGALFLVIKKAELPEHFRLTGKQNIAGRHSNINFKKTVSSMGAGNFRPFLMHAVTIPFGHSMPKEYLEYVDENGLLRRDGLPIYLGQVFSAPEWHKWEIPSDPSTIKPHVNARDGMEHTFKIILDPDDAILPL